MINNDYQWPLEFHRQLLQSVLKNPPLRVDLTNQRGVGTTFYRKRGKNMLIVHQINRTVPLLQGEVNPLKGGALLVDPSFFKPAAARQIHPTTRTLTLTKRGDMIELELPMVEVHSVFLLEG